MRRRFKPGEQAFRSSPRRYGEERLSAEKKLGDRVVVTDPANRLTCCWLVDGIADEYATTPDKYGRSRMAHRFTYSTLVGPIPEGHVIHHVCGNKGCVNPKHLEPMTPEEHTRHHAELRRSA